MHLVFDIFQGIGVAAAVGIRPFLPALAVGALAAGDVEIHFDHTDYSFLQSAPFLLVMVVGAIAAGRCSSAGSAPERLERGPVAVGARRASSLALGALLFAGSLCRGHYAVWPGMIGGVICAAIGDRRHRARCSPGCARGSTRRPPARCRCIAEGSRAAARGAVGRGAAGRADRAARCCCGCCSPAAAREEQKYAGLRILR